MVNKNQINEDMYINSLNLKIMLKFDDYLHLNKYELSNIN